MEGGRQSVLFFWQEKSCINMMQETMGAEICDAGHRFLPAGSGTMCNLRVDWNKAVET